MKLLQVRVSHVAGSPTTAIQVRIEEPPEWRTEPYESALPFTDAQLQTVFKALQATKFSAEHYTQAEIDWLRREHFVVGDARRRRADTLILQEEAIPCRS